MTAIRSMRSCETTALPFERSVGDKYASFNTLAVEGVEQK
jgi:hypothetical protein